MATSYRHLLQLAQAGWASPPALTSDLDILSELAGGGPWPPSR
jgi:hypothetical protein